MGTRYVPRATTGDSYERTIQDGDIFVDQYGVPLQSIIRQDRAPTVNDDIDSTTLGVTEGTTWYDTTTGILYVCTDATDGAAVWQISSYGTPQGEVTTIDVGPSGDYATLGDAINALGPVVDRSIVINLASGDIAETLSDVKFPSYGGADDSDSFFAIRGSDAQSVLDDNSGSNYTVDTAPDTTSLTVSGTPFTADNFVGKAIEFVTGTNAGKLPAYVQTNTTNAITHGKLAGVSPGDEFRIVRPSTRLVYSGATARFGGGAGFTSLFFQNVAIQANSNSILLDKVYSDLYFKNVYVEESAFQLFFTRCNHALNLTGFPTVTAEGVLTAFDANNTHVGTLLVPDASTAVNIGACGSLALFFATIKGTTIVSNAAANINYGSSFGVLKLNACATVQNNAGTFGLCRNDTLFSPELLVRNGLQLVDTSGILTGIFNNDSGDAIFVVGGRIFITDATKGTGTGGYGVRAGQYAYVYTGGATPTISGSSGDAVIANGSTSTWATINGGTPLADLGTLSVIGNGA